MKLREDVRRQQERDEADANGTRPYVSARARGRPPGTAEERARLAAYLEDFARELHDEAPLAATVTRALNAFRAAGVPPERWSEHLYRARAVTQQRSASIAKWVDQDAATYPSKNKMAYYFAVLDDLLGLRPAAPRDPATARASGVGFVK